MNYDLTIIERDGYTILDVLSDVGGLQGILISAIAVVLNIINHNQLENYLVSKLFKAEAVSLADKQIENIKEYCLGILPDKLVCCAKRRKQIAMDTARTALEKEMDVIELIRSLRFVHRALKHLLSPTLHKKLQEVSQQKQVCIAKEESSLPEDIEDKGKNRSQFYNIANETSTVLDVSHPEKVENYDDKE